MKQLTQMLKQKQRLRLKQKHRLKRKRMLKQRQMLKESQRRRLKQKQRQKRKQKELRKKKQMPKLGWILGFCAMASLGLPGLAGFWGEFPAILSAWNPSSALIDAGHQGLYRALTVIAALGTVLAAAYLLWLYQRTAFGEPSAEFAGAADHGHGHGGHDDHDPGPGRGGHGGQLPSGSGLLRGEHPDGGRCHGVRWQHCSDAQVVGPRF